MANNSTANTVTVSVSVSEGLRARIATREGWTALLALRRAWPAAVELAELASRLHSVARRHGIPGLHAKADAIGREADSKSLEVGRAQVALLGRAGDISGSSFFDRATVDELKKLAFGPYEACKGLCVEY